MKDIVLTAERLQPQTIHDTLAKNPKVGAVVMFSGFVRNHTNDRDVKRLEFEAYVPMAISEMSKIAQQAKEKWPVEEVIIHHRVGILDISEIPVVIGVSSPHRKEAFEACMYCIDTLKETVPIWKKEVFEDGEVWVSATP